MTSEQEFEELRQDYLEKAELFMAAIRNLNCEDLKEIGTKGKIANLQYKAICSYSVLSAHMCSIPVRVGFPYRVLDPTWKSEIED